MDASASGALEDPLAYPAARSRARRDAVTGSRPPGEEDALAPEPPALPPLREDPSSFLLVAEAALRESDRGAWPLEEALDTIAAGLIGSIRPGDASACCTPRAAASVSASEAAAAAVSKDAGTTRAAGPAAALASSLSSSSPPPLPTRTTIPMAPTAGASAAGAGRLAALRAAAGADAGRSGVCGTVWSREELAFKCKTCERDPTCAICVPCFRAGDHTGHDFAMIRTHGGCCDCGDVQAWKPAGFCIHHGGASPESVDPAEHMPADLRTRISYAARAVGDAIHLRLARVVLGVPIAGGGVGHPASGGNGGGAGGGAHDVGQDGHSYEPLRPRVRLGTVRDICSLIAFLAQLVDCGDAVRRVVSLQLARADPENPWILRMLRLDGGYRLPHQVHAALHSLYYTLITDLVFKRAFLERLVDNYEQFVKTLVDFKTSEAKRRASSRRRLAQVHGGAILVNNTALNTTQQALQPQAARAGDQDQPDAADINHNDGRNQGIAIPQGGQQLHMNAGRVIENDTVVAGNDEDEDEEDIDEEDERPEIRRADVLESFSVQLFTVPALVPVMIRKGGLLDVLINVLLHLFEAAAVSVVPHDIPVADGCRDVQRETFRFPSRVEAVGSSSQTANRLGRAANRDGKEDLGTLFPVDGISYEEAFQTHPAWSPDNRTPSSAVDSDVNGLHSALLENTQTEIRRTAETPVARTFSPQADTDQGRDIDQETINMADNGEHGLNDDEDEGHVGENNGDEDETDDGNEAEGQDVNHGNRAAVEILTAFLNNEVQDPATVQVQQNALVRELLHFHEQTQDQDGQNSAARIQVARARFLDIIDARRQTRDVASGRGPILHPLRMDWSHVFKLVDRVWFRVIVDLRYVLTHSEVVIHLVHHRPDLLRILVRLLSMMQGMNPTKRQYGEHVVLERDLWAKAFTLEVEMFNLIEMVVGAFRCEAADSGFSTSPGVISRTTQDGRSAPSNTDGDSSAALTARSRARAVRIVRRCLDEWLEREQELECISLRSGKQLSAADSVSMHLPLHRLLAVFGHHMIRMDNCSVSFALTGISEEESEEGAMKLLAHPLRLQVFLSQVRAGIWKRNGRAVVGQAMLYRTVYCAEWFVDFDIFFMQQCLVVMGPAAFAASVVRSFDMQGLLRSLCRVQHPAGLSGGLWEDLALERPNYAIAHELGEYDPILMEDMLTLIVHVTTERARSGYSDAEHLRRKLLHRLSIHDQTHSQLLRWCPRRILESKRPNDARAAGHATSSIEKVSTVHDLESAEGILLVESVLASIAEFSQPRDMEQGRYQLKEAMWEEFDPFLPHLTMRERAAAEDRLAMVRKRQKRSPQTVPTESVRSRPLYPALEILQHCTGYFASTKDTLAAIIFRRALQPYGLRTLEGSLTAAFHLAITAVESISRREIGDIEIRTWLDELGNDSQFAGSTVASAVIMYQRARADSSSQYFEYLDALTRLLTESYTRGNATLKSKLRSCLPAMFETPILVPGDLLPCIARDDAELDRASDDKRKHMLRMKKEKQAAAMARMQAAQAQFASQMEDMIQEGRSFASSDGPIPSARSGGLPVPDASSSTMRSGGGGKVPASVDLLSSTGLLDELPGASTANQGALLESTSSPSHWQSWTSRRKSCISESAQAHLEKDALGQELVCALCRESDANTGVIGLIGFAQETKVPVTARERQWQGPACAAKFRTSVEGTTGAKFDHVHQLGHTQDQVMDERPTVDGRVTPLAGDDEPQGLSGAESSSHPWTSVEIDSGHIVERGANADAHELDPPTRQSEPVVAGNHQIVVSPRSLGTTAFPNDDSRPSSVPEILSPSVQAESVSLNVASVFSNGLLWPLLVNGIDAAAGIHFSFCGHAVHVQCFQRYFSSLLRSHASREVYEGYNILNLDLGEFLCPVCRRMGNIVLPVADATTNDMLPGDMRIGYASPSSPPTFDKWFDETSAALSNNSVTSAELGNDGNADTPAPVDTFRRILWGQISLPAFETFPYSHAQSFDTMLWSHTSSVLSRIAKDSTVANTSSSESVPVMLSPVDSLCAAVGTTIAAAEISARTGIWDGCQSSSSRRTIGIMIRQSRARMCTVKSISARRRAVVSLWNALLGFAPNDSDIQRETEPFLSVLFLLFLWPSNLSETDVLNIVRLGYIIAVFRSRRDGINTLTEVTLYLRRVSVFLGILFDVNIPLLSYPEDGSTLQLECLRQEQHSICQFLEFPSPEELLASRLLLRFSNWLNAHSGKKLAAVALAPDRRFAPRRFGLISLPSLFQDLLEEKEGLCCVSCCKVPRDPALCLSCNSLYCSDGTHGDRVSACKGWSKQHARECGAGIGLFLVLKTTTVFIFRNNRRSVWGSPYLDEHGEEDMELRRGKPLHLSCSRYSALESLWLSHGFDHNARVLRTTVLQYG